MDVVEPAADGGGRSLVFGRHRLRVHGVQAMNAERPLDGGRLAPLPRLHRLEGVLLPRGQMPQEVLGRPVAPADRRRPREVLVPEPFYELADRLVFFLEDAKRMRLRRCRRVLLLPRQRPDVSERKICGSGKEAG